MSLFVFIIIISKLKLERLYMLNNLQQPISLISTVIIWYLKALFITNVYFLIFLDLIPNSWLWDNLGMRLRNEHFFQKGPLKKQFSMFSPHIKCRSTDMAFSGQIRKLLIRNQGDWKLIYLEPIFTCTTI